MASGKKAEVGECSRWSTWDQRREDEGEEEDLGLQKERKKMI